VLAVAGSATAQETSSDSKEPQLGWVISADDAKQLLAGGNVTVLDTRGRVAFLRGHVPGAVRVDWTTFSQPRKPHRGKLLPAAQLQAELRKVGVQANRPVVVVGAAPKDWGEDGRIVWMLRAAGHKRAAFVDGGHAALVRAGVATSMRSAEPKATDFVVRWTPDYSADRDEVRDIKGAVVIDTREGREYHGGTPYGESRGGPVPGAKHLHFKSLLADDGTLLRHKEILARLGALGATPSTPIIAYCTGGVRSGWLVAVLLAAGFSDVRNYAGSMWEYAAAPAAQYPLAKP
jgi:thiosulfate/3-mercaptopyruvate sulfurtransferase